MSRGWLLAWGLLLLGVLAGLVLGGPLDWGAALTGPGTERTVLLVARLPRLALALLAGSALALAGGGLQGLVRNPLAEPYTLGVASGAALGTVMAGRIGMAVAGWGALLPLGGALGATLLVLAVGTVQGTLRPQRTLLAGVALSITISAVVLWIHYLSSLTETLRILRWTMGGLQATDYTLTLPVALGLLAGAPLVLGAARDLQVSALGDGWAKARGVDLGAMRSRVLWGSSLLAAGAVAVAGPVAYVGLIVPHLLRRVVGPDPRRLLPLCLPAGAGFLALCDGAARAALPAGELPVGIVTALLGGPFFLYLLARGRA
ncbi:iron ABC transporter permease [bacterium]|nr:iron ABC transporter permease [bacterium]